MRILDGLTVLLAFGLAAPALASDGVLEINQTCATQTGCFAGDAAGFPITINGSAGRGYRLTSDLVVPNENTDGIQISTQDIGIDLNNFRIQGPVVCSGTPVSCTPSGFGTGTGVEATPITLSGISLRNATIIGMGSHGANLGIQAEVTHVRARSNRSAGIVAGAGSTLTSNTVYLNGLEGVIASGGSTVLGNTAYANGLDGIVSGVGSTVSGNTAQDNGTDGINVGSGSTVSGNSAYSNEGDGISASSGSNVLGNTVRFNAAFGLNLSAGCGYRENVTTNNVGGTVGGTSFVNLGNNACNGTAVCP